jgi:hypothetical protein
MLDLIPALTRVSDVQPVARESHVALQLRVLPHQNGGGRWDILSSDLVNFASVVTFGKQYLSCDGICASCTDKQAIDFWKFYSGRREKNMEW